jgi:hypothetical protein
MVGLPVPGRSRARAPWPRPALVWCGAPTPTGTVAYLSKPPRAVRSAVFADRLSPALPTRAGTLGLLVAAPAHGATVPLTLKPTSFAARRPRVASKKHLARQTTTRPRPRRRETSSRPHRASRQRGSTRNSEPDPGRGAQPPSPQSLAARSSRSAETLKVHVAPGDSAEAARAAIGHLVEEWAALTYRCLVEALLASEAASVEPIPRVHVVTPTIVAIPVHARRTGCPS